MLFRVYKPSSLSPRRQQHQQQQEPNVKQQRPVVFYKAQEYRKIGMKKHPSLKSFLSRSTTTSGTASCSSTSIVSNATTTTSTEATKTSPTTVIVPPSQNEKITNYEKRVIEVVDDDSTNAVVELLQDHINNSQKKEEFIDLIHSVSRLGRVDMLTVLLDIFNISQVSDDDDIDNKNDSFDLQNSCCHNKNTTGTGTKNNKRTVSLFMDKLGRTPLHSCVIGSMNAISSDMFKEDTKGTVTTKRLQLDHYRDCITILANYNEQMFSTMDVYGCVPLNYIATDFRTIMFLRDHNNYINEDTTSSGTTIEVASSSCSTMLDAQSNIQKQQLLQNSVVLDDWMYLQSIYESISSDDETVDDDSTMRRSRQQYNHHDCTDRKDENEWKQNLQKHQQQLISSNSTDIWQSIQDIYETVLSDLDQSFSSSCSIRSTTTTLSSCSTSSNATNSSLNASSSSSSSASSWTEQRREQLLIPTTTTPVLGSIMPSSSSSSSFIHHNNKSNNNTTIQGLYHHHNNIEELCGDFYYFL